MSPRLCIFCCENFRLEVEAAVAAEGWDDVCVVAFPSRCGHPPQTWDELRPMLAVDCTQVAILGSACLQGVGDPPADWPPVRLHRQPEYFHLVASAAFVDDAIARGAYLITPGWLDNWREQLRLMGFDEGNAAEFFRDFARELLLLDSGVVADAPRQLDEFAKAVGLPATRVAVGIDHVRAQLARLVAEWRLENAQHQAHQLKREHARELANHKAALDFLGRLPLLKDEAETVAAIAEMFHMLFAPQQFHYVRVENGTPHPDAALPPALAEQIRTLQGDWAWTAGQTGFLLRFARAGEALGVAVAADFAFPEYRERYLNLALSVAGVAGLAIDNARTYRRIKETEQALRQSERNLNEAQRIARLGSWTLDQSSGKLDCSDEIFRVFEIDPNQFGFTYDAFLAAIHPGDRDAVSRAYAASLASRMPFEITHRLLMPDGRVKWAHERCMSEFDATGKPLRSIGTVQDITAHKQAEIELDGYRLHLEELVAERTRELADAKDAAEAANRAKSIFLANMSHELRTPLNAILGFAQIMERDKRMPEDERRNIATINRSGSHLLSLINDVLEISRIESGRIQIIREAFDLPAALTAVEELIRIRAEAKGLAFVVERSADLPAYVQGDAHHLRQVLINLLGNAVKYTDSGQITLGVRPQGKERIRFDVTDTGPGIAKDEQERIFQAFYQTEGGIAKGEGTGLGLSISRAFVQQMGGDIAITSESGKGSSFSFDIPLPATDAAPNAGRSASILGLVDGQAAPRILVAEDHPDNQQVVEQLLKRIGCQVQIAANGQLAVDFFQTWRPQLIFMDMRMPVMDGYQATRTIRSLPGGETIPIVALTASTFEEDLGQVLAAGCNEMVKKPIEQNRLYEVIGRLLGLRFDYAEAAPAATATGVADLNALPADVRKELREAAVTLDSEAILTIVERLRSDQCAEADTIADLVEDYRFDRIEELCR